MTRLDCVTCLHAAEKEAKVHIQEGRPGRSGRSELNWAALDSNDQWVSDCIPRS